MNITEIEIGKQYRISGDIADGYKNGEPYISHENVVRAVKYITDTHVVCVCDRRFLINKNLKIEKFL